MSNAGGPYANWDTAVPGFGVRVPAKTAKTAETEQTPGDGPGVSRKPADWRGLSIAAGC